MKRATILSKATEYVTREDHAMIKHNRPYNRTVIAESRAEVPAALAWLIASQVDDTRTVGNAARDRIVW